MLVKGSNYLEALSKTKTVALDKTGTMTKGVFEVSAIHHSVMEDKKLLELAAHAELFSTHPIAKSIREAYRKTDGILNPERVSNVMEIGGNGITACVDGLSVAVGNGKLMERLGVAFVGCHHTGTIIHVATEGKYAGHIVISDVIKPTAKEAVSALSEAGVNRTVMLTGDAEAVGAAVAKELGIDEVHAELLPEAEEYLTVFNNLLRCAKIVSSSPYTAVRNWFVDQFPLYRQDPLFYLTNEISVIPYDKYLDEEKEAV